MTTAKKEILTFLLLLVILSSASFIFVSLLKIPDPQNSIYFIGYAFSPALAGLITALQYNKNMKGFGWKWGKTRYQLLSYFLPVFYGLFVYGCVWLLRIVPMNQEYLNRFLNTPNLGSELLTFATIGVVMRGIGAFGEELGWRGYLLPRLMKTTNLACSSLIIGLIWSLWHLPIILFTPYGNNIGIPGILLSTLGAIAVSFVMNWIRLKSGSIWPSVILHASHNKYIQDFYDPLTSTTENSNLITGEFGVGLAIIFVAMGFIFWRFRHSVEDGNAAPARA